MTMESKRTRKNATRSTKKKKLLWFWHEQHEMQGLPLAVVSATAIDRSFQLSRSFANAPDCIARAWKRSTDHANCRPSLFLLNLLIVLRNQRVLACPAACSACLSTLDMSRSKYFPRTLIYFLRTLIQVVLSKSVLWYLLHRTDQPRAPPRSVHSVTVPSPSSFFAPER